MRDVTTGVKYFVSYKVFLGSFNAKSYFLLLCSVLNKSTSYVYLSTDIISLVLIMQQDGE